MLKTMLHYAVTLPFAHFDIEYPLAGHIILSAMFLAVCQIRTETQEGICQELWQDVTITRLPLQTFQHL